MKRAVFLDRDGVIQPGRLARESARLAVVTGGGRGAAARVAEAIEMPNRVGISGTRP